MASIKAKLSNINTLIFDVDGVISDGSVWTTAEGEQIRRMNIKDGYALQHAIKKDFLIIIISGGTSENVRMRLKSLGIKEIHLGARNKMTVFQEMVEKYQLNLDEILYMGDDIPDYPLMCKVGFSACPNNAANEIKNISDYISSKNGGEGCVRDILEQVLKIHDKWFDEDSFEW